MPHEIDHHVELELADLRARTRERKARQLGMLEASAQLPAHSVVVTRCREQMRRHAVWRVPSEQGLEETHHHVFAEIGRKVADS